LSRTAALEQRLGHRFADRSLLERALTHRSRGAENNERLEFLGDGVLGCAVAEELYRRFPDLSEGKLTRLRASVVREEALAQVASALGLGELLLRGEGELANAPSPKQSMLADAMEAVFGAVFVDGGYPAARDAVLRTLEQHIGSLDPQRVVKDPKTSLQELLQAAHRPLPEYHVRSVQGAAHQQSFEVECILSDSDVRAIGTGASRQKAEQDAAQEVLRRLDAGQ
jgi:ribonuclease-3